MKNVIKAPLLLAMCLLSSVAVAGNITNSSVAALMDLSGVNKELSGLPDSVKAGMQQSRQRGAPLTEEQFTKIEKAVGVAFAPKRVTNTISKRLKSDLTESDAKKLLVWYKSDLGKKITKAEDDAATPEAQNDMLNQAESLLADEERVKLAKRIDETVNVTEIMLELQKNTATTIYTSLSKAMNPGKEVDLEAFEERFAAQEDQMRQQLKQYTTLSLVYKYKKLSVSDVEKYTEFLAKPYAKKFNDSVINGIREALNNSIKEMATSLAKTFTAQK